MSLHLLESPESSTDRPAPPASAVSLDEAVSVFVALRPRLFAIAYRMLGSAAEAEDVVQDVWMRWQRTDRSAVVSPAAFLSRATTRLSINVTQSAWSRRRQHLDPLLPEPVDPGADPEARVQRAEELDHALLLVLGNLTPAEQAVYILREAFDYTYADIAERLRLSPVNVRKIASRARMRLRAAPRETVATREHRRLRAAFVAAARDGDIASLENALTPAVPSRARRNGIT
ncbi:RNA polymerase sigma factor [Streptomyces laurentii]|uniref:RNA polymerase sigma factor n=1 Tax=Streptomyces laurentii TaxID=39478 RepID=A0A169PG75_STRLU|nr:RNA polymerase sigma factor [Streptomyces laurentii]